MHASEAKKRPRDEPPTSDPSFGSKQNDFAKKAKITDSRTNAVSSAVLIERPSAFSSPGVLSFRVDDERDHAETPFVAYRDLAPFLQLLADSLGVKRENLRIYDPFFCAGSVVVHLRKLGFHHVINRNEDFYAAAAAGRLPAYDVLVTNPPFSGQNLEKIFTFAASCGKPWAILAPDFCFRKPYYSIQLGIRGTGPPTASSSSSASSSSGAGVASGLGKASTSSSASSSSGAGVASGLGKASASTPSSISSSSSSLNPQASRCGPLFYMGPTQSVYTFSAAAIVPPPTSFSSSTVAAPPASASSSSSSSSFTPPSFQCIWFLALGPSAGAIVEKWRERIGPTATCALAPLPSALPNLVVDPSRRRREEDASRRSWRKKQSRQRKKIASAATGK